MKAKKLQPNKKSFGNYIKLGYEYASEKAMSIKQLEILDKVSYIDSSILILDDIIDNSELRNNKPCLYKEVGIDNAIIEAQILLSEGKNALISLIQASSIKERRQLEILEKLNILIINIYEGERIGKNLAQIKDYSDQLIEKYIDMVTLFTGSHIRFGLEIGQLLANKEIDEELSKASLHIGIVRQVYDDFEDYFPNHHEPFSDFLSESNRLPEVFFKKQITRARKQEIIKHINKQEFYKVREKILTNEVRRELYDFCEQEVKKCKRFSTKFDYSELIENYEEILTKM